MAPGIKLKASDVAEPFRAELRAKVEKLKQSGIEAPLLVGILANDDPAAMKYAEWTGKACRADGLRYELRKIDDPLNVEQAIRDANADVRVHGMIVYYPIFGAETSYSGSSRDDYLRDTISHECDVEGLTHLYRTSLYQNIRFVDYPKCEKKCLLPCTSLAVVKILETCKKVYDASKPIGKRLEGANVTIINRSEIVGRPLAAMLANDGANVYSVDIESIFNFEGSTGRLRRCAEEETVEACVRKSNIVITGVPVKSYKLPTKWVQPGTVVVNVASFKNVDEEELLKIEDVQYCSMVGKVTVAMLQRNLMRLYENFHHPEIRKQKLFLTGAKDKSNKKEQPWYGSFMQLYTAIGVTALIALQLASNKK